MPIEVVEATAIVKLLPEFELAGVNIAVAPVGRPLTLKLKLPLNPLIVSTAIGWLPLCP